ncbi:MAG TPA: cytosine permease [Steroidobacteraceae bacterium]|nr:cytosine permease [Steroidobacteraceae bacterium]
MSVVAELLRRVERVAPAHPTAPVPLDESVAGYRVAVVCIGIAFTLTGLYMGSEIGLALGWRRGVRAAVIGSVILSAMSIPAAIVGARTRLSTYMIVRNVFGRGGSRAVNLVLALVLIGWYAVTAELFGRTCYLAISQYAPQLAVSPHVYTIMCSVLVILTTIFGFRALDRLSLLVAPLLVALTVFVAYQALKHASWAVIGSSVGTDPDMSLGTSAVVGGMIVNVVLMPDLTRYSRTALDCALISVTGNGIANGVMLVLAMLPALAFGEQDPMKYMALLGLAGVAFIILVLSTWTVNAVNLYSAGLVTATAMPSAGYGRVVIGAGLAGTLLATLGLADRFLEFLAILGLVVPPIAAVYLTDFFVLRRSDYQALRHLETSELTNVNGLVAFVFGAVIGCALYVGKVSLSGVPTIESFVSAGLVYWVLEKVRARRGRDRMWRA